jgi:hypothetical protein
MLMSVLVAFVGGAAVLVDAAAAPLHDGWLTIREELERDLLDAGASRAFAVADHQVAHIYVPNCADIPNVRRLVESVPGVEQVLDAGGKRVA